MQFYHLSQLSFRQQLRDVISGVSFGPNCCCGNFLMWLHWCNNRVHCVQRTVWHLWNLIYIILQIQINSPRIQLHGENNKSRKLNNLVRGWKTCLTHMLIVVIGKQFFYHIYSYSSVIIDIVVVWKQFLDHTYLFRASIRTHFRETNLLTWNLLQFQSDPCVSSKAVAISIDWFENFKSRKSVKVNGRPL